MMAPYVKWMVIEEAPEKLAERVIHYLDHPNEEKILIETAYKWVKQQTWENLTALYARTWNGK